MDSLANALRLVSAALERLGIAYLIGGSVASSSRGVFRAPADIDLVARIGPQQARALSAALGRDWYADSEQIRDCLAAGRSFNIIHIPTSQKVDIFPATDAFQLSQLQRATRATLELSGETGEYPVATSEDILLAKLHWYRMGGEVSELQWSDVAGILAVARDLDATYLRTWAARLGVEDLLDKAVADAKPDYPL
jgi:hypothetical protein